LASGAASIGRADRSVVSAPPVCVVVDGRGHPVGMGCRLRRGVLAGLCAAAAAVALGIGGCGGDGRGATLPSSTAARLHGDVDVIRRAAESGDRDAAIGGLDRFSATVARAARRGRISAFELARFRRLARQARQRIAAEVPTSSVPGAPQAPAPAGPPAVGQGDEDGPAGTAHGKTKAGRGKGKAKGKGHGKGGGGG
jgi:hypothetical protein